MSSLEHRSEPPHSPAHEPHIVSLETMQEQMELQKRLALLHFQATYVADAEGPFNPSRIDATDREVRDAAMKIWVADYAKDFRTWFEDSDPHRRINMDDVGELSRILQEILIFNKERTEHEASLRVNN